MKQKNKEKLETAQKSSAYRIEFTEKYMVYHLYRPARRRDRCRRAGVRRSEQCRK